MRIQIHEGEFSKKARLKAYQYLKELYRREKLNENGNCYLRSRIDRGASKERI